MLYVCRRQSDACEQEKDKIFASTRFQTCFNILVNTESSKSDIENFCITQTCPGYLTGVAHDLIKVCKGYAYLVCDYNVILLLFVYVLTGILHFAGWLSKVDGLICT